LTVLKMKSKTGKQDHRQSLSHVSTRVQSARFLCPYSGVFYAHNSAPSADTPPPSRMSPPLARLPSLLTRFALRCAFAPPFAEGDPCDRH
jgi:hypothetical protein